MDITDSVAALLNDKTRVIDRFYELLLSRHPELRKHFDRLNLRTQATMLTMALASVEAYYQHRFSATENYFQVLGHRHFHAGVRIEDFDKFEAVLLCVLAEFHGADWVAELADQWRQALALAIARMRDGYRQTFVM